MRTPKVDCLLRFARRAQQAVRQLQTHTLAEKHPVANWISVDNRQLSMQQMR
jgi:hypothetical protein